MRFEAKRKSLSEAVNRVVALTHALAPGAGAGAGVTDIQLFAEAKRLAVRTVLGGQVVECTVREFVVEEPGCATINMEKLAAAISVSGDLFKAVATGGEISFACGRSKGRISVSKGGSDEPIRLDPEPDIEVKGFKALLKAIALKAANARGSDRTFHIEAETIRGEATDTMRAVIAIQQITQGEPYTVHSFNLPHKILDALPSALDGDGFVRIGVGERFFTLRGVGLALSIPRTSGVPLKLVEQLDSWLGALGHHALYSLTVRDLTSALADALSLATNEGKLALVFTPGGCRVIGSGDSNAQVEVEFEATTAGFTPVTAQIQPQFLTECLKFYRGDDRITVDIYDQAMVLNIASADASDDVGIVSQTTAIPLLELVTQGAPEVTKAKKTAKAPAKGKAKAKAAAEPAAPAAAEPVDDDEGVEGESLDDEEA